MEEHRSRGSRKKALLFCGRSHVFGYCVSVLVRYLSCWAPKSGDVNWLFLDWRVRSDQQLATESGDEVRAVVLGRQGVSELVSGSTA